MLRKLLIVLLIVVVLAIGAILYFITRGPDLSVYERFREPAIINMPTQKMVVVEAIGSPENTSGEAIKLLFNLYFKLEGVPKGHNMPAPRARWPKSFDTAKEQWIGRFALPVPDVVTVLPQVGTKAGLTVKLDNWDYGEVAQILHIGPYNKERPTIERLHAFIKKRGYEVAGEHEEEYLRGPSMFGKGDPEKYYTLIRCVVRPSLKEAAHD